MEDRILVQVPDRNLAIIIFFVFLGQPAALAMAVSGYILRSGGEECDFEEKKKAATLIRSST
jgi:hypothetical protein